MDIRLVRSWASPSTLHLRVMITGKDNKWSQFRELSVPLEDLDESVLEVLLTSRRALGSDPEQPELPYTD